MAMFENVISGLLGRLAPFTNPGNFKFLVARSRNRSQHNWLLNLGWLDLCIQMDVGPLSRSRANSIFNKAFGSQKKLVDIGANLDHSGLGRHVYFGP